MAGAPLSTVRTFIISIVCNTMTIPNAPRLGTCRQAMRKERERKRELNKVSFSAASATTCSIFRFRRIFIDSVRSRDEDSYKGRASVAPPPCLRRVSGMAIRELDCGSVLCQVPGVNTLGHDRQSSPIPSSAADQEHASLPRSLFRRGRMKSGLENRGSCKVECLLL